MTAGPTPSSAEVSRRMQRQPRAGTRPELELRRALHSRGLRYRIGWPVPGMSRRTVDIAFTRAKVAVFVDGCFWHGCPDHASWPAANADWWRAKIEKNQSRDVATTHHLHDLGWWVVRVWEHEAPGAVADRVEAIIRDRHIKPASPVDQL